MNFLAPSMFGFLALAAIPIILYFLFRRKKEDVPWGAIYILRRTLEKESKVSVWKQYFIIFLRTLAFIALPMAFLLPHLPWRPPAAGGFPAPPSSTHRFVLLDSTESMDAAYGSGTCYDVATSLCRKLLCSTEHPGRVEVQALKGDEETARFDELPLEDDQVSALLARLPRQKHLDLEGGLRAAIRSFRSSHFRHHELYILSDYSARDLKNQDTLAGLFQRLDDMNVRVFCLSYENPKAQNFALLELDADVDLLLAGQPTLFYLKVGYYGHQATADTWLTIKTDKGEVLYEETVSLAQGEKTLEIPLALVGGEQTIVATLKDDDFPHDNELRRSFRVADSLRVLVIQDINLKDGFENPRKWLELALGKRDAQAFGNELAASRMGSTEPAGPAQTVKRYIPETDFVNSVQVNAEVLNKRDAVILLDIDTLDEEAVAALQAYMARGGTVLFAPGPQANPEKFNQNFAALLPMPLDAPARESIDPDVYDNAILDDATAHILRELEDAEHGNFGNARFYNFYQSNPEQLHDDAALLFSLSNGAPLLSARRHGRGQALLWTAGMGMDWQSMVVHPIFPVFFARMFNIAASGKQFGLNLQPGMPIIREVSTPKVIVHRPDNRSETIASIPIGDKRIVRYDGNDMPGTYGIQLDPEIPDDRVYYHVYRDRGESDYRPLGPDLRTLFEQRIAKQLLTSEAELVNEVGSAYDGRPLTGTLAAALLIFLLAEAGLSRRWFS